MTRRFQATGLAVAGLALVAAGQLGARAAPPAAASTTVGCAWALRLDPNVVNFFYPDQAANYWITELPAVPGETLTIRGEYPHARYISFTSYDGVFRAVDGLNDQHILADAGSTNPFFPHALRTAVNRSYTVHAIFGQRPPQGTTQQQNNYLYTTSQDGSHTNRTSFLVVYRVYRVDRQYASVGDIQGGEPLPSVTVNVPGAAPQPLQTCPQQPPSPVPFNQLIANTSIGYPEIVGFPGTTPPTWHKFYNAPEALTTGVTENQITGDAIGDGLAPITSSTGSGGFLENPDNAYIFANLSTGFGPLAIIHGRLPTFPHTFQGQRVMGTGQLRYWSMCSNDGLSERYFECLTDDSIVTDSLGNYTIVVSNVQDRPSNATTSCGINWLDWGPLSDTLLIVRNMLPAPTFLQAIQNVRLGHERQDMGPYFPATSYATAAKVAALGCH
jgi:hypothetical protein